MPDVYKQAEEALIALAELEAQAREDARRNSQPEPQPERVLADRLAAARSNWVSFDWGSAA
jgi:hypothetical protein